jgi:hypothetical protein
MLFPVRLRSGVSGQPRQEHLEERVEESFKLSPPARSPNSGEDESDLQIGRHESAG